MASRHRSTGQRNRHCFYPGDSSCGPIAGAPRRTLRFVLFGGEEEGLMGSHAYVERHKAEMPSLDAVLISDTGSQRATGWYVMGREDEKDGLAAIEPLVTGLGADQTSSDTDFLFRSDT